MKKRIFRSILLVAVAVLLSSLVLIMGVLYRTFTAAQFKQLAIQNTLAARGVAQEGMDFFSGLDTAGYRITWVAGNGTVLYDSSADASSMENHADREEILEAMESGRGQSERRSATLAQTTLYHAQRLSDGSVVRLSVTQNTVLTLVRGVIWPALVVLLAAAALSALLAGRLSRRIVRPLNDLNLDAPLDNEAYEELAPLLTRIEKQQRQIQGQIKELQQERDEFFAVTDSMSEGLILLSNEGIILSINQSAARLFGAGQGFIGRDILTVERSRAMRDLIRDAREGRHAEAFLELESGLYQVDASPVLSGGALTGIAILAFDVTEKMLSEKRRREFSANVSHELKTPLQSILGSAELIENGLVMPKDMPRFISRIRSEAGRLMTLIDDIIRLSQLDEAHTEYLREEVELRDLAQEVADALAEQAGARGVKIKVLGQGIVRDGIRRLLWEIVYNLCDNAVKYNVENGHVDICVSGEPAGGVKLNVTDTGIGIPPEHQSRVFERFYRVDKSHSKETGGTGLGLSIVKHAAACHGACVELESGAGTGTTVRVVFPGDRKAGIRASR